MENAKRGLAKGMGASEIHGLSILTDYLSVAGAGLALLFALESVLGSRRPRGSLVAGAFFFSLFLYLLIAAVDPLFPNPPASDVFLCLSLITYTCLGPLGFIYMLALLDPEFEMKGKVFLLPAVPLVFALVVLFVLAAIPLGAWPGIGLVLEYLIWISFGINMIFFALAIYYQARLKPAENNRGLRTHLVIILVLILGIVLVDVFASYGAGTAAAAFVLLYGRILRIYRPDLRTGMESEGIRLKYQNSKLQGMDIEALCVNLERLLREERLFARENLTLPETAELMDLTPHQLSELVNTTFQKSFKAYLNENRVAAARESLLNEPERDVTAIAFDSGFNSLSSFYRAMKDVYGESPGDIRKKAGV